ncbi:MAG: hypothetical protein ACLRH0_10415 [Blautia wexlerae]
MKNNADFRQPRISSPPAEADQTASPARAVRFKAVGLGVRAVGLFGVVG